MKGLRLIATGGALPGRTVTNEELSRTVDTSDEWITTRTGIRTRHYCTEGENAATLAIAAAKQALQRSGLAPADIACCVCATLSAPDATPSVACQVQAALALPENRPALDVNAACSGFLYGTAVARGLLATLGGRYALVIGTEALSRLMDPADRSTCVLFGDGAGAVVLEAEENAVYTQAVHSIGSRGEALTCVSRNQQQFIEEDADISSTYMQMDGKEVFKFAVSKVPEVIMEVLEKAGKTKEEIRFYMLHQANKRIVASVSKHMNEPLEKYPMNIENLGNTSSASIPLLLDEWNKKGRLNSGDWIILSGFGGGLTYGASLLQW